jgi:predicted MFS family arabinose efflux permease
VQALRERNFRVLFFARAISFFGTNLAPIAVAFAVLGLSNSATDVGLAFAAWTLTQISTLLVGGVVGDRLPRQLVMIGSDSANCVVRLTMGLLLVTGHAEVWHLVALQAVGGAATAFYSPASSGLVPQTVRPESLQQANALMNIARYAAFPVGAAVGGTIVATIGAGYALLLDGGTYATSAALLTRLRLAAASRTAAARNFARELADGWRAFTEHTWVWVITLWISLYFLITYAPFFVLGPYVAKHSMGGVGAWATVVTGEAIGALAGGLVALRYQPNRSMIVIGAVFAVTAVQSILLAATARFEVIAIAAALAGFAFSYGSIVYETAIQRRIEPDKLARVSAYGWMGAMAFLPAGYALAGPVANAIGISTTLYIGAAWIVVTTMVVCLVPSVRDFRMRDELTLAVATA